MAALILILEDDSASRELLQYLLQATGYRTLQAADGAAGLAMALEVKPDLVICDLQMPKLNGFDVMRGLRADPRWHGVAVVAVTAFSMAGDREASIAAGFSEHITKPIDPRTFVAQIEAFLPPEQRVGHSRPG